MFCILLKWYNHIATDGQDRCRLCSNRIVAAAAAGGIQARYVAASKRIMSFCEL